MISPLSHLNTSLLVMKFHVTVLLGKFSCSILKVVGECSFILALCTEMVVTGCCISHFLNSKQNNFSFYWHLGEVFGSRISKMRDSLDISAGRWNPGS